MPKTSRRRKPGQSVADFEKLSNHGAGDELDLQAKFEETSWLLGFCSCFVFQRYRASPGHVYQVFLGKHTFPVCSHVHDVPWNHRNRTV